MEIAPARPAAPPHRAPLELELQELASEAGAWFDPLDDQTRAELAELARVFASSSLVDLSRPDSLNLVLLRTLARLPDYWDDAHVFAGVALAAIRDARDDLDDEAWTLRYLAAARDALRLAELVDAPRAHAALQTEAAADARHQAHRAELLQFADAWRALAGAKYEAKKSELVERLGKPHKTIERWITEARRAGLID
jgi:hypothetical protein